MDTSRHGEISSNGKTRKPGAKPGERGSHIEVGTLVTQSHGGALRHGSKPGTNRGGSGRPKNEFKAKLGLALDQPEALRYVRRCLRGEEGPSAFFRALEFCTDRVYGKIPNITQASGDEDPLIITLTQG